jgi:hypothetical protein
MRAAILTLGLCAAGTAGAAPKGLAIGGFDVARGGIESLGASDAAQLKAAILAAYPHSKIRLTKKLTVAFLTKVKVLVLGVAYGGTQGITPLSTAEQTALGNFVKGGGTALLYCDNNLQFSPASNSFANPFGLTAGGVLDNGQIATFVTGITDPIMTGPFGTATQFETQWPGWFTALGSSVTLANLAGNGAPEIAYLPAGALGTGSGAVVLFGDSSTLIDSDRTMNNQIALLNGLALTP